MPCRLHSALGVALLWMLASAPVAAIPLDHLLTDDDIGLLKVPHRGRSHIMVLTMRVGSPYSPQEWAQIQSIYDPAGGPGTFRGFWQEQSNGEYDPIPTLMPTIIYDECPVEALKPSCLLTPDNFAVLSDGSMQVALLELIERARDEAQMDLSYFDVNSRDCPSAEQDCPDGFFDGVVVRTSVFSGLAFPIGAFNSAITVETTPGPPPPDGGVLVDAGAPDAGPVDGGPADAGPTDAGDVDAGPMGPALTVGILALGPPDFHEFAHTLGLIDMYGGPPLTGLMDQNQLGLSAFAKVQLGWVDVVEVTGPSTHVLGPSMEAGQVLKIGDGDRYVLIEHRGGPLLDEYDGVDPGVYQYSVDEGELPTTPLGFIDVLASQIYLPNEFPPYCNVNVPLNCQFGPVGTALGCASGTGAIRNIQHTADGFLDLHFVVESFDPEGDAVVDIRAGDRSLSVEPDPEPDAEPDAGAPEPDAEPSPSPDPDDSADCGCSVVDQGGRSGDTVLAGLALLALAGIRRHRRGHR